ncbi:hypothetical protein TNCV_4180451 [Trichonephila clavipes]|nr:hypothetical protein TNCV_4180451 [Trichonephila clavipes]
MQEKGGNRLVPGPDYIVDPVVVIRYLNLVFDPKETTHNKLFLSSPTKYTVDPWMLVWVWPPFELLHRALTTIVFAQYCRM